MKSMHHACMSLDLIVVVLLVNVAGALFVHEPPQPHAIRPQRCPEGSIIIPAPIEQHAHCACLKNRHCVGTRCSIAIHAHQGTAQEGEVVSGFRTDCPDCRCAEKPQISETMTVEQNLTAVSSRSPTVETRTAISVVVVAASANHVCPLLEMLASVAKYEPQLPVVVYDLDYESPFLELDILQKANPLTQLRRFDYTKYPDWFNISLHAGQYAWKPVIIKEVVDEFESAMWVDSGNRLAMRGARNLLALRMQHSGFYSPSSPGSVWKWVHQGTMAYYGIAKCCNKTATDTRPCCCCTDLTEYRCTQCDTVDGRPPLTYAFPVDWMDKEMCNGALIAFSRQGRAYNDILVPWVQCALDKRCIAPTYPEGGGRGAISTRGNHRQDQAAISLLAHFAGARCNSTSQDVGFVLHVDKANEGELCNQLYADRQLPEHDRNPL
eukprot:m.266818 g.266818  ORF g.266818 m.266818 type:complete len:437 (-) comp69507_c0_seq1:253-1563(-)